MEKKTSGPYYGRGRGKEDAPERGLRGGETCCLKALREQISKRRAKKFGFPKSCMGLCSHRVWENAQTSRSIGTMRGRDNGPSSLGKSLGGRPL